jgi:hypothetical protein
MLKDIMNSIKRIQISKHIYDKINIYDNYVKKIKNRYDNYDYSKFSNSDKIYQKITSFLNKYENQNKGKISIIHGDPVMTNIIIDNKKKIKFIDMRGKVGDDLTICGDWLYDWAKLYQSLIGYDKILLEKNISNEYEKKMIDTFEKYFSEMYSSEDLNNLKMITKSLLFSLIPLHNNDKCYKYYDLIEKI